MNIQQGYGWSTHQPLIKATLELFDPKFVLELGSGEFSTPLLIGRNFTSIENDIEWVNYISEKYEIPVIHHFVLGLKECDGFENLSHSQVVNIIEFYENLFIPQDRPNLLFVDHWRSLRMIAINKLKDKFDLIIYHDSEAIGENRWDLLDVSEFESFTLKTDWTSTTLLSKIGLKGLDGAILPHIESYKQEHSDCKWILFKVRSSRR